jgi:hypothetical protein
MYWVGAPRPSIQDVGQQQVEDRERETGMGLVHWLVAQPGLAGAPFYLSHELAPFCIDGEGEETALLWERKHEISSEMDERDK